MGWIVKRTGIGIFFAILAATAAGAVELTPVVEKIQPAVVTLVTYDIHRQKSGFGSGFFVDGDGHLVTNFHVMDGAYFAEVRTHAGETFPVVRVVAENREADLIKVRIDIPKERRRWLQLSGTLPSIAEQIVVVGSPMGLDQTVSEGIVSAIRDMPGIGKFFQISAPISRGSSGGPVVNMDGQVIGIVTFMMRFGQNLNFAVSAEGVAGLTPEGIGKTVSEWTYANSLKSPGMAEELCRQGLLFSVNGDYAKAIDFYREATEQDPENTIAWYGLGNCYDGLAQTEEAVAAYQQAIRINPEDPFLRFSLANYLVKLGRLADAIASYEMVVQLDPDNADAYAGLAMAQTEMGRYEAAIKSHGQVIRVKPESSAAYYNLGITLGRLEKTEEAIEAFRKAVAFDADNLDAFQNMAILLTRANRYDDAIAAFKQAIRIDPDHGPSHYLLGKAFLDVGNKPAALDEYKILKQKDRELADRLFGEIYK